MLMPPEIRKMIEHLGMRTGCVVVYDQMRPVRVIKAKHAYYDLPNMFRHVEGYDLIRWHGCDEGMIDHTAEELRKRYNLPEAAVIRPKVYHQRKSM